MKPASAPHLLALYQRAVQHPQAMLALLQRMYQRVPGSSPGSTPPPTRLREDFAGSALLATTWVALHPNHRAMAIENHRPTFEWAQRQAQALLGSRTEDLHLLYGDVLLYRPPLVPRVDLIAALNYSTFIYHERTLLRRYFQQARRSLRPQGILVLDALGPPTARLPRTVRRRISADLLAGIPSFTYHWEERSYDPLTGRVDCRMHFSWRGAHGKTHQRRNAFVYDWRWWSLPELVETMREAGFPQVQVWMYRGHSGKVQPVGQCPGSGDYHAYVVGRRIKSKGSGAQG